MVKRKGAGFAPQMFSVFPSNLNWSRTVSSIWSAPAPQGADLDQDDGCPVVTGHSYVTIVQLPARAQPYALTLHTSHTEAGAPRFSSSAWAVSGSPALSEGNSAWFMVIFYVSEIHGLAYSLYILPSI